MPLLMFRCVDYKWSHDECDKITPTLIYKGLAQPKQQKWTYCIN